MLDCLGHHPLLRASDLCLVLDVERQFVQRALPRLLRRRLVVGLAVGSRGEIGFSLTALALQLLAARDLTPARRYARHTSVTAMPSKVQAPLPTLLHQRQHTVGVNSFFLAWLDRRPPGSSKLLSWLSAAEAAVRFERGGQRLWLRPDGTGHVLAGGRTCSFFLEWDRGTERLPVLAAKLARYREFFAAQDVLGREAPSLLLVTTTPNRELLIRGLASTILGPHTVRLCTTTASLLERLGPRAAVWLLHAERPRAAWPPSATTSGSLEESQ